VVEITQNDEDSSPFWAKSIFNGHLDVFECDEGRPSCRRIAGLYGLRLDTFAAFDESDGKAVISFASNSEAGNLSDKP